MGHFGDFAFPASHEGLNPDAEDNRLLSRVINICRQIGPKHTENPTNFLPGKHFLLEEGTFARSRVLISIMRNYSLLQIYHNRESENSLSAYFGASLMRGPYVSSRYTFLHSTKDHLSKLRIAGCGRKGLTSFSFHELINVYDQFVWFAKLLCTFLHPVATTLLLRTNMLKDNNMSVLYSA